MSKKIKMYIPWKIKNKSKGYFIFIAKNTNHQLGLQQVVIFLLVEDLKYDEN